MKMNRAVGWESAFLLSNLVKFYDCLLKYFYLFIGVLFFEFVKYIYATRVGTIRRPTVNHYLFIYKKKASGSLNFKHLHLRLKMRNGLHQNRLSRELRVGITILPSFHIYAVGGTARRAPPIPPVHHFYHFFFNIYSLSSSALHKGIFYSFPNLTALSLFTSTALISEISIIKVPPHCFMHTSPAPTYYPSL